jgi:glycosyltransferase involved in cell wall biosynthesis
MLSSILDQEGDIPEISVSVAHVTDSGNPTTNEVVAHFKDLGMDIRSLEYPDIKRCQYRGYTRNDQLAECEADWIMFTDSDMVYPNNFFAEMKQLLQTDAYKDSNECLYSQRYSTQLEPTTAVVDQDSITYPIYVENSCETIMALPGKNRSNIGAGYFQLVSTRVKDIYGYYVPEGKSRDHGWTDTYSKCRSDQQFRRMVGKKKIPLPVQGHIQHVRDSDTKSHIEVQR